jgi:hypothetical protein
MSGNSHDSRATIASAQFVQIQNLLRTILPANRFYRDKFASLDLSALTSLHDFPKKFRSRRSRNWVKINTGMRLTGQI